MRKNNVTFIHIAVISLFYSTTIDKHNFNVDVGFIFRLSVVSFVM